MAKAYKQAGVDIEAGYQAVALMKEHVQKTMRPEVLGGIGGFGGLFDLSALGYRQPVLISGTDGVGTKLKLAFLLDRHDTIGIDCVAMCVNDILVQGAEPLFSSTISLAARRCRRKSPPSSKGWPTAASKPAAP